MIYHMVNHWVKGKNKCIIKLYIPSIVYDYNIINL